MSQNELRQHLISKGRPLSSFKAGMTIHVSNKMKKGYSYTLSVDPGTNMDSKFKPFATPGEMLAMGVFEGKYLNDCVEEFPAEWYWNALLNDKLRPEGADVSINHFGVNSRQPLQAWIKAGWIPGGHKKGQYPGLSDPSINPDERGWFQWFCRYWMGRRLPVLDAIQIKRWSAFNRHAGQIKANCSKGDLTCRPRQRQGLLQWAHNPFL